MSSTVCIAVIYDNRILRASENTTFALDGATRSLHVSDMDSADEIRAALRAKLDAKKIAQKDIAAELGIGQPNVATLFNPGRNGKLRGIDFDEGMRLIRRFNLEDRAEERKQPIVSEDTLARLLHALGPSVPKGGISESAAQALSVALLHALELLSETGASEPTDREMAMAVRAAMSRFREASRT